MTNIRRRIPIRDGTDKNKWNHDIATTSQAYLIQNNRGHNTHSFSAFTLSFFAFSAARFFSSFISFSAFF